MSVPRLGTAAMILPLVVFAGCGDRDATEGFDPGTPASSSESTAATLDASSPATASEGSTEPPATDPVDPPPNGRAITKADLPDAKLWTQVRDAETPSEQLATRCGPSLDEAWAGTEFRWDPGMMDAPIAGDFAADFGSTEAAMDAFREYRERAVTCEEDTSGAEEFMWTFPVYENAGKAGYVLGYATGPGFAADGIISHGIAVNIAGTEVRWAYYQNPENKFWKTDVLVELAEAHEDVAGS